MDMKRKIAGHATAFGVILATIISLQQGWIAVTEVSAALAFTLVGATIAILYWTWKPEINRWFTERSQPKLAVSVTELKDDERIAEIEVVLRDGAVRKHQARFCYVTVKNSGRKSAEDVHAYYDGAERIMFMPLRRKRTFKVDYDGTARDFDHDIEIFGEGQAFVLAALNCGKLEYARTIHPGPVGETFVLLFSVKDFRCLTIPSGSRLYPNYNEGLPCSFRFPLILVGKDMPDYYLTTFMVNVDSWDSLNVEKIGETVRSRVKGSDTTIAELMVRS
jgi:hypothetical protein